AAAPEAPAEAAPASEPEAAAPEAAEAPTVAEAAPVEEPAPTVPATPAAHAPKYDTAGEDSSISEDDFDSIMSIFKNRARRDNRR
ncbi:MAG: hypothetical protein IKC04_07625, partial [Oscillospiraceae bacterium]|nr:hypothetical protein [Oscillospiraceae bacterium]